VARNRSIYTNVYAYTHMHYVYIDLYMFVGIHIYLHIHVCSYIDCGPQSSLNNIALLCNTADTYIHIYTCINMHI